jgi:HAD superfamily hydrolase (TIGR01509 family)
MKRIDTILFDWDGTLVDSAQIAFDAMRDALGDLGILLESDIYKEFYSPNWYRMYEAFGLQSEKWQIADALWLQYYERKRACLVEGGYRTVWELRHRGYELGIVSSGSDIRIRRELNEFGLEQAFNIVLCNEDILNKKPHPEGLERAMEHLNKKPDVCTYIGDSPEDVEMGKRAKVLTAGVRSGYPCGEKMLSANPDIYMESIGELLDYFKGY